MTCRHAAGDPNCSSHYDHPYNPANVRAEELAKKLESITPDASNYTIEDFARVGSHVVVKAKYPNCVKCSYEGIKIMVFLNVTEADVIRWRKIDPHFREPTQTVLAREAPGPAARFPGSLDGWKDAIDYAERKR